MKKKLLTLAMAAAMAISTALTSFAATEESVTLTGFASGTSAEILEGDFDVTYTFNDKSTGTDNWDNAIVEFWVDGAASHVDVRLDRFGWLNAHADKTAEITWTDSNDPATLDWATWANKMRAGEDVTINVVRKGNTFTITTSSAGYTFVGEVTSADYEGKKVGIRLTGEEAELTNIKFKVNTKKDDAANGDAEDNNNDANAGTTTPTTGDVATALPVALLVAAAVAVVAMKKRSIAE